MASLASSLTALSISDSTLTKPSSLFSLRRPASLKPSISALQYLSISFKTQPNLTPFIARSSSWTEQEVEEKVESEGEFLSETEEVGSGEEQGGQESPEDAKIYVGNLPFDLDTNKLAELFEQAGRVETAEVIYNRETDTSRGFGFVTMMTVEEAEKAIESFNRYEINGRTLRVNKAAAKGERIERPPRQNASNYTVYVGNLPWSVDEARLEQVFSEHGKVVNARVVYDRETGRSRGFAFVSMETQDELDDAIAALDGQELDGRSLRVNVAEDRPRRAF